MSTELLSQILIFYPVEIVLLLSDTKSLKPIELKQWLFQQLNLPCEIKVYCNQFQIIILLSHRVNPALSSACLPSRDRQACPSERFSVKGRTVSQKVRYFGFLHPKNKIQFDMLRLFLNPKLHARKDTIKKDFIFKCPNCGKEMVLFDKTIRKRAPPLAALLSIQKDVYWKLNRKLRHWNSLCKIRVPMSIMPIIIRIYQDVRCKDNVYD